MTYEAWRISYQCSEQAARAAFQRAQELEQELGLTRIELDHKTKLLDSCEKALAERDGLSISE